MRIEDKVNEIAELAILDVMDLTVEHLSYMFDVHILYNHQSNFYVQKAGVDIIGLKFDKRHEMFKAFCHEAGHMFLHATNQKEMPQTFNQLQEAEAEKFALLLQLPENLIIKNGWYEPIDLMTHFNVSEDIAIQRLEMLRNRAEVLQLQF